MSPLARCSALEPLDDATCRRLLEHHHLGRLALVVDGVPLVLPVNYAWVDGTIVFGTDDAGRLRATSAGVVGFQIDSVDVMRHEGWSVYVTGPALVVGDDEPAPPVTPWCGADHRSAFVRIRPDHISGRRIDHGHGRAALR